MNDAPPRIAYLINMYPAPSGTFIRRELLQVESRVGPVERITVRRWHSKVVDPVDVEEEGKTRVILDSGAAGLGLALLKAAAGSPGRFLKSLRLAWKLGRRGASSGQGRLKHVVYLAEACVLRDWLRQGKIDHLHTHFGTNSATVALLCRKLGGPPYSVTVHGSEEYDRPAALALDEKVRNSAFAVAVCEFGRSQLSRWVEFEHWPKVRVVHCGLDPMFLKADPVPVPDAPKLICVGRLVEQKGLPVLIEAAARLKAEGIPFELSLVGGGELEDKIRELIARNDLGDSVRLLGWKTNAEIRDLILESRALVLSSFAECLPIVLMEAMALGRPVVATWIAGIPELVRPGENGWLVPASSVDGLTDALREVLAAPTETLEAMGRRGAARVADRHDAVAEADKLLAMIHESLGREPQPAGA